MVRTRVDQLEHDGMIRVMAEHFRRNGYTILANLPGYESPPEVNGHVPDLLAIKTGQKILLEVATANSFRTYQTYQQFKAFSFAQGVSFHAAVPKSFLATAQLTAATWSALPAKWWFI